MLRSFKSFTNSDLSSFEYRISYSENIEGKGEENTISIVMNVEIFLRLSSENCDSPTHMYCHVSWPQLIIWD